MRPETLNKMTSGYEVEITIHRLFHGSVIEAIGPGRNIDSGAAAAGVGTVGADYACFRSATWERAGSGARSCASARCAATTTIVIGATDEQSNYHNRYHELFHLNLL